MANVRKALTKRYLVRKEALPPLSAGTTVATGYLSVDPAVRLRVTEQGATLQIWSPGDKTKFFQYDVPLSEAESMMEMCFQRTSRTTWSVEHGGRTWRVHEYLGRHSGVVTAVLELTSRIEGYEEPPWVSRNVTGDRRYTDEGLATLQLSPPAE